MFMKTFAIAACILVLLGGCGTSTPQIAEFYDKGIPEEPAHDDIPTRPALSSTAVLEFELEKKIFCDLREAAIAARAFPYGGRLPSGEFKFDRDGFLPLDWVVEESLSLQVDESTALNPGAVLTTPLPNGSVGYTSPLSTTPSTFQQSFGLGLGGTLSSTATRIDKFDPFFTIKYLIKTTDRSVCLPGKDPVLIKSGETPVSSPFVINGDLGLKDWLVGALYVSRTMHSLGPPGKAQFSPSGFHPDVLTIEIKFIVTTSGNVNPTWKLVRVSANSGTLPLAAVGRTRTHDLIITIGPPKGETSMTHFASQIGSSVSASNRAALLPSQ